MRHSWPLVGCDEGRGMYGVELYAAVRLAVVDEGLSHRKAARRFGIDRRTVKKMLSYSAPPGYRRTKPVRRPRLDGFTGIVDTILEADNGSGRAAQAASHGAPDLRAPSRRARVHRRLYHREGLCPGPAAVCARGLRCEVCESLGLPKDSVGMVFHIQRYGYRDGAISYHLVYLPPNRRLLELGEKQT